MWARWIGLGCAASLAACTVEPSDDSGFEATTYPDPDPIGSTGDASTGGEASTGGPVGTGDGSSGDTTSGDESSTGEPVIPMCGNGIAEGSEQCDGEDFGEWDCLAQGFEGGDLICNDECKLDTTECFFFICGNGTVQGDELCDGDDTLGVTCEDQGFDSGQLSCNVICDGYDTSQCGTCGNGVVDGAEVCEAGDIPETETCELHGFDSGTVGCTDCAIDTATCGQCGNGVKDGAESCDGVDLGGESCASLGLMGGTLACLPACLYDVSACTIPALDETYDFPVAGDPSFTLLGGLPWNAGDYFEGTRMTMVPSLGQLDMHLEIINNILSPCGFQEAEVSVNGIPIGTFVVMMGTTAVDMSFPVAPAIPGPVYTVRYETTTTVAGGCGSAGYALTGSTVTFSI